MPRGGALLVSDTYFPPEQLPDGTYVQAEAEEARPAPSGASGWTAMVHGAKVSLMDALTALWNDLTLEGVVHTGDDDGYACTSPSQQHLTDNTHYCHQGEYEDDGGCCSPYYHLDVDVNVDGAQRHAPCVGTSNQGAGGLRVLLEGILLRTATAVMNGLSALPSSSTTSIGAVASMLVGTALPDAPPPRDSLIGWLVFSSAWQHKVEAALCAVIALLVLTWVVIEMRFRKYNHTLDKWEAWHVKTVLNGGNAPEHK